jgi:hypothetical protein
MPATTMRALIQPLLSWRAALCLLVAVSVASGCGGGVGTGGTGGNATAYASGPITGFGSVIVGGVRFDDVGAEVQDVDGGRRSRDDLRLGMTVEVESSAITTDASGSRATASRIRFESELVGLVGLLDVAGGAFTILGQRVAVDTTTVFDERLASGLAGLSVGQALEVYAVFDAAAQRYRATRVEPALLSQGLRLRGPLAAVDTVAQTLRIGANTYSFAGASGVPAGLAAGQFVRLRLAAEFTPARWVVRSFDTALQPLADVQTLKVEGLINSFTSAQSFSVGGRLVDASAASFPDGTSALAVGTRVKVEGAVRAGVLRASQVSVESDQQVRDRGFEIIGALTAVNPTQRTITLRGFTIGTARLDLRFEDGSAADLVVGRTVEVKGFLSADQRNLDATRIRFR